MDGLRFQGLEGLGGKRELGSRGLVGSSGLEGFSVRGSVLRVLGSEGPRVLG